MRHSKVAEACLVERCLELRKSGMTQIEIAALLSSEAGIAISQQNIYNFLASFDEELRDSVRAIPRLAERAAAQELDINDELLFSNKKAHELLERYEQGDKEISPIQILNFLQRQIEFMAKRLSEISDAPQINIMVNQFEIFQTVIFEILREVGGQELEQRFISTLRVRYDEEIARA